MRIARIGALSSININQTEDEINVLDKCIKYKQIRSQIVNEDKLKLSCSKNITKPSDLLFDTMQDVLAKYVFLCNNCNV